MQTVRRSHPECSLWAGHQVRYTELLLLSWWWWSPVTMNLNYVQDSSLLDWNATGHCLWIPTRLPSNSHYDWRVVSEFLSPWSTPGPPWRADWSWVRPLHCARWNGAGRPRLAVLSRPCNEENKYSVIRAGSQLRCEVKNAKQPVWMMDRFSVDVGRNDACSRPSTVTKPFLQKLSPFSSPSSRQKRNLAMIFK